jgi:WD40 repeat protein
MSIGIAQIKQVIGLRSNVTNCIAYQDEQTIVYPAGSNTIIYNIDQKTQKYIPCSEKSAGMTTMCISQNKRYIAIAEKVADKPLINIYDLHTLRKRKTLIITDIQSTEIISMSFSPDSKHLITQSSSPDWVLHYWSWEKSKIMAFTKITANLHPSATVNQVKISNISNTNI